MMHNKIVIANSKFANYGKSTSVKYVFEILSNRYKHYVIEPASGIYDPTQDVEAIIEIPQVNGYVVKVGIESMGDPGYARPKKSINDFLAAECEIILVACRNQGDTINTITNLEANHGYTVLWLQNGKCTDPTCWQKLEDKYGDWVADIIEKCALSGTLSPTYL